MWVASQASIRCALETQFDGGVSTGPRKLSKRELEGREFALQSCLVFRGEMALPISRFAEIEREMVRKGEKGRDRLDMSDM